MDLGQDAVALQQLGQLVRRLGLCVFGEPCKEAVACAVACGALERPMLGPLCDAPARQRRRRTQRDAVGVVADAVDQANRPARVADSLLYKDDVAAPSLAGLLNARLLGQPELLVLCAGGSGRARIQMARGGVQTHKQSESAVPRTCSLIGNSSRSAATG